MNNPFGNKSNPANIFTNNNQSIPLSNQQTNQQAQNNPFPQNNQNTNTSNPTSPNNIFQTNASKPSGGTIVFNNFNAPSNTNSSPTTNLFMNANKPSVPNPTGQAANTMAFPVQNTSNNVFQGNNTQNNQAPPQGSQNINANQSNQSTNPTGSINPLAILSKTSGANIMQAVTNPSSGPTLNLNPNPNNQNSKPAANIFNKNNIPNTQGTAANQQNQQGQPTQPQPNSSNAQQGNNMSSLFMNKNTAGTGTSNAGGGTNNTGVGGTSNTGGSGGSGGVSNTGATNNTANQAGNMFNNGNNNQGANNPQTNTSGTNNQGANQISQGNNGQTTTNQNQLFSNNNTSNKTGGPLVKDTEEIQFDKSNQTIEELIQDYKTSLKNSYEELKKLGEKTIRFLDERQDFIKIEQNFTEVEKMLVGNSEDILKSLDSLQRQQRDILQQVEGISRKIGQGQYTHELTTTLQQYNDLKKRVIELHEEEGEWKDPGQQQLINLFDSLNEVEMQIKEMDQMVDVYLAHS